MAKIQSEGTRVRLQPGSIVDLTITMPSPKALCSVAEPGGIKITETRKGVTRTIRFTAPASPWSGTFAFAFAFLPDANGDVDPAERFKLAVDDPTTPMVDLNISTIRPRPGNLNPIPFVLDFIA